MSTDDGRPPALVNPYLRAPRRPAVWGVTLGRVGLAAAGVLAVAAPTAEAPGEAGAPASGVPASVLTEGDALAFGPADDVQAEVDAMCMPAGYLWPAQPAARPQASPIFCD